MRSSLSARALAPSTSAIGRRMMPSSLGSLQPRSFPHPVAREEGRQRQARHSSTSSSSAFDPRNYTPDMRFSTAKVDALLQKSLLHEFGEDEAKTRIELAACYRLFELAGWNENIFNHLSAKVYEPDGTAAFLINPFGLRYGEVTASSLLKVDLDGGIKHPGSTGDLFGINKAGYVIHSAIHRARPDVHSVMHCHEPSGAAVSCAGPGLLPLSQTSHTVGPVGYHDYRGIVVDTAEQKSLVEDLGDRRVLILRNHGVLTASESVSSAWLLMYQLLKATLIQSHASACALGREENLALPPPETVEQTIEIAKNFTGLALGAKELSAYMRWLDKLDPSYRN
ncbi:hypothetical protein CDD83_4106 [Cordyceps sp. RAO-2017]|nr:hypothetical protein CDD83_4106 [Cordyceps sp. RAO-2017]